MNEQEMIQAVRSHAIANYNEGGWDFVVECYDDGDILELISDSGAKSEKDAIAAVYAVIRFLAERRQDAMSAADW
jgi:hypothetical protein